MKILAIVPSIVDTNPGQRYRMEQWAPLLAKRGVQVTFAPFETSELNEILYQRGHVLRKVSAVAKGIMKRHLELQSVTNYDLVYVFREAALLGPAWFERRIAAAGVPIVFDFDDAIFVPYRSPANGYLSYLKFPTKTRTICRLAAHVMAGNSYLADYARQVNKHVSIVPSTVNLTEYSLNGKSSEKSVPVIGWTGSYSTVPHLNTLRSAFQQLAKRHRFRLRVIGAHDYTLPGVDVEAVPWRSQSEVDDLRPVDIGIMPVPDDRWSRGKCGMKALQYMGLGIATVCSPVGMNCDIIDDEANGLLAASREEWIAQLSRLLQDARLRARLGQAGRKTVEQRYSSAVHVPRVHQIMQEAVAANERNPLG